MYRLIFSPESGQASEGEVVAPRGKQAVIKIVTTVGMIAFVEPRERKVDFDWKVEGRKVVFRNGGNLHILAYAPLQCPESEIGKGNKLDISKCRKIDSFRIYPGKTRTIEVDPDSFLRFEMHIGEETIAKNEEISIPK